MLFPHYIKIISHSKNFIRFYSIPKGKALSSALALSHFDQFYASAFKNWPSIRLGLLCPHYYCAVVNVFSKRIMPGKTFHDMDLFNMKDMYRLNLARNPDSAENNEISSNTEDCQSSLKNSDLNEASVSSNTWSDNNSDYPYELETASDSDPDVSSSSVVSQEEYMPATKFKNREEYEEDYEFTNVNLNYKAQLVPYGTIHYPENWDIYFCQRGKFKRFPPPQKDVTGLLNYYLMDGASVLPVLALDIKKGDDVGDLCASPGGKSLLMLFGMQFGKLVVNDVSRARLNKLKDVLDLYIPGTEEWSKKILVSNLDVAEWSYFDAFDKILLDVPCTNDRLSVSRDNNNIFAKKRFHERMLVPKLQTNMLCAALKALKPGGSLVYSTCSLSPIQNDGVVHVSLARLEVECDSQFVVDDLTESFYPVRNMFQFSDNCRYGQLVVPFLPLNYGPMYIAKITRNK